MSDLKFGEIRKGTNMEGIRDENFIGNDIYLISTIDMMYDPEIQGYADCLQTTWPIDDAQNLFGTFKNYRSALVCTCLRDGLIIGVARLVWLEERTSMHEPMKYGSFDIDNLVVRPEFRNQGIGQMITALLLSKGIRLIETKARSLKVSELSKNFKKKVYKRKLMAGLSNKSIVGNFEEPRFIKHFKRIAEENWFKPGTLENTGTALESSYEIVYVDVDETLTVLAFAISTNQGDQRLQDVTEYLCYGNSKKKAAKEFWDNKFPNDPERATGKDLWFATLVIQEFDRYDMHKAWTDDELEPLFAIEGDKIIRSPSRIERRVVMIQA